MPVEDPRGRHLGAADRHRRPRERRLAGQGAQGGNRVHRRGRHRYHPRRPAAGRPARRLRRRRGDARRDDPHRPAQDQRGALGRLLRPPDECLRHGQAAQALRRQVGRRQDRRHQPEGLPPGPPARDVDPLPATCRRGYPPADARLCIVCGEPLDPALVDARFIDHGEDPAA